jgi:hypothetical protein
MIAAQQGPGMLKALLSKIDPDVSDNKETLP